MRLQFAALILLAFTATPAVAAQKVSGDWMLNVEEDKFSDDAKPNVVAMRANSTGDFLALRCLQGRFSLALAGQKYETGDRFVVLLRVDKYPPDSTVGAAISELLLEIESEPKVGNEMLKGR
jgi:hypothetical protein